MTGLSVTEAGKQHNYFHFREPVRLNEKTLLEKADLDKSIDFLDPIHEDIPKGNIISITEPYCLNQVDDRIAKPSGQF